MDAVNLEGIWLMGKKIPVPVPVAPRRSQGGVGIYPWWRIEEFCKNPIDQEADDVLKDEPVRSEDQKGLPPQVPSLEEWTLREELRRLRKHLDKVKGEVIHLRSRDKGAHRELLDKNKEIDRLRAQLEKLSRKILKLRRLRKMSILEFKWMAPIEPAPVQPQAVPEAQPVTVAEPAGQEAEDLLLVPSKSLVVADAVAADEIFKIRQETWDQRLRALVKALPWAAGSIGVYLATNHLVPKKNRVLRTVGYAVAGALGVVSLVRGISELFSKPSVPSA